MKQLRNSVPFLGIAALLSLFLRMPEIPDFFGIFKCKSCDAGGPYLPMVGAAYFAVLISLSLLFPSFPNRLIARGGLVWAVLLALKLTYFDWPYWCLACIIGHACHIFIWTIWLFAPSSGQETSVNIPVRGRLFMTLFSPILVVALFSSLNLTFMVYHLKSKKSLQPGDAVPSFAMQNFSEAGMKGAVINFVSPSCHYCQEQLPIVDAIAAQFDRSSYRFINISPALPVELTQLSSHSEWFEDKDGTLRKQFEVAGFPTLFIVGNDAKIHEVIAGVPQELKPTLLSLLKN